MNCPKCQSDRLTKCDKNKSGTDRYQCLECKAKFTPKPNKKGGSKPKYGDRALTEAEKKRLQRARKKQQE